MFIVDMCVRYVNWFVGYFWGWVLLIEVGMSGVVFGVDLGNCCRCWEYYGGVESFCWNGGILGIWSCYVILDYFGFGDVYWFG